MERGRLAVPRGQVADERAHLRRKLKVRDPARWHLTARQRPRVHPLFRVVRDGVAEWERREPPPPG